MTDTEGIKALSVASLRSMGIAARLNNSGQAELLADGKSLPILESSPDKK